MYCPLHLGVDKTTVSVATGSVEYHPLYFSIGNVHNTVRRAHRNAVVPIGFLTIPKSMWFQTCQLSWTMSYKFSGDHKYDNDPLFRKFKRQLYHATLTTILKPLCPGMTEPVIHHCPDGHYWRIIYDLAGFIVDYPEQVMLAGTVSGWCPKSVLMPFSDCPVISKFHNRCTALPTDIDGLHGRCTRAFTDELLDTLDSKIYKFLSFFRSMLQHSSSFFVISCWELLPIVWKDDRHWPCQDECHLLYISGRQRLGTCRQRSCNTHLRSHHASSCDIILHSTWKTERPTSSSLCSRKSQFLLNYTWKKLSSMQDKTTIPTSAWASTSPWLLLVCFRHLLYSWRFHKACT